MTTPPNVVPFPPTPLVSEWTTMSAPCSIGFNASGVATVLCTINGIPHPRAAAATVSISTTLADGLPMLSQKRALVFSSISASTGAAPSSVRERT